MNLRVFKTRWMFFVGVLVVLAIVAVILLPTTKPKVVFTPSMPAFSNQRDGFSVIDSDKIKFGSSVEYPSVPKEVVVPQYTTVELDITNLASRMGLTRVVSPNVYLSDSGLQGLTIDGPTRRLIYTNTPKEHFSLGLSDSIDLGVAESVGVEFVKNRLKLPLLQIEPAQTTLMYQSGAHLEVVSDPNKADVVVFSFWYVHNNNKLSVGAQSNRPPVTVQVDRDMNVTRSVIYPYEITLTQELRIPTITVQESLKINTMIIIEPTYTQDFDLLNKNSLKEYLVESISVVFQIVPESGLTYPFYRLDGVVVDNLDNRAKAPILLPAVKIVN